MTQLFKQARQQWKEGSLGFRLVITPGLVLLWPVFFLKKNLEAQIGRIPKYQTFLAVSLMGCALLLSFIVIYLREPQTDSNVPVQLSGQEERK